MNQIELTNTLLSKAANKKRFFAAIAGPPASGKTTLSESLANSLAKETSVAVVAMDGFHYDNNILEKLNLLDRTLAAVWPAESNRYYGGTCF